MKPALEDLTPTLLKRAGEMWDILKRYLERDAKL